MTSLDAVLGPLYILIVLFIASSMKHRYAPGEEGAYFIPALLAKIFGAVALALIYQFYYGDGDTFYFFRAAQGFWQALSENPFILPKLLASEAGVFDYELANYTRTSYFKHSAEWNTSKFAFIASLTGFNTYLITGINFAIFCFAGQWSMYTALLRLYPEKPFLLLVAVILPPSSVFWSSGLLKDTLVLGGICFIFSSIIRINVFKEDIVKNLLITFGCGYIVYLCKDYPLLFFIPCIAVWYYAFFFNSIKNAIIRVVILPILLIAFAGLGLFIFSQLAAQSNYLSSQEEILATVNGFHVDHGSIAGGSTYSIGEVEYTIPGMLRKLPLGLQFTLYRPFPFEARNVVVLITAMESFAYLMITVFIFFRNSPISLIKSLGNPEVALCISYTIILGSIVGFVSINYGALARFKTPILPFFCTALLILFYRLYDLDLPEDDELDEYDDTIIEDEQTSYHHV